MQQNSKAMALALALGLMVATPGLTQSLDAPPERIAPSAAPAIPSPPGAPTAAPRAAPTPPLSGANSFTESQARSRIEAAGFTQVAGLVKSEDGIWRGQAMRGGAQVVVTLDYRGDVAAQQ